MNLKQVVVCLDIILLYLKNYMNKLIRYLLLGIKYGYSLHRD